MRFRNRGGMSHPRRGPVLPFSCSRRSWVGEISKVCVCVCVCVHAHRCVCVRWVHEHVFVCVYYSWSVRVSILSVHLCVFVGSCVCVVCV